MDNQTFPYSELLILCPHKEEGCTYQLKRSVNFVLWDIVVFDVHESDRLIVNYVRQRRGEEQSWQL